MQFSEWTDDFGGARFRISIPDDGKHVATVSRWSNETEEYVENCQCAIAEVGRAIERMIKHCPTSASPPCVIRTRKQRA
jgi:hypothetical protein